MKKKLLALLMAAVMALSAAGCGLDEGLLSNKDVPDAQLLLEKLSGIDSDKYTDLDMDVQLTGVQDGQRMETSFQMGAEMAGGVTHIYDGNIRVAATGLTMEFSLESWSDSSSGYTYQNMTVMGQETGWLRSPDTSDADMSLSAMPNSTGALYSGDGFTVTGPTNGYYTMEWTIPAESLSAVTDGMDEDGVTFDDAMARATFDSQSLEPLAVLVSAAGNANATEALLTLSITYKTINGDKILTVPEDVVSSAVDDDGYDDGYTYDEPDWDVSHDGLLYNDKLGYDPIVDDMAEYIVDNDPGATGAWVYHYCSDDGVLELANVSWSTETDDWYGSAAYAHMDPEQCDWFDPGEEFLDTVAFLKEYYASEYDRTDACIYEDDNQAAFLFDDEGYLRLEWCFYEGDVYAECTTGAFTEDKTMLFSKLKEMLAYAALDGSVADFEN